jgi:DNA-binding NarL/FixJ family response regulator
MKTSSPSIVNMSNGMIRVLVVEDHPVVRYGISTIIADEPDMELVGEAPNGTVASAIYQEKKPNVVLIDLSLPDIDGIDLIRNLRKIDATGQFVVLTTRTGSDDINRSLAAGAHAYLFKDIASTDLLNAVRIVAEGGRYVPPSVGRRAEQSPNTVAITARERDVLVYLSRGLTNEKIGESLDISHETVKSHIKNIFGKLGLENRSEAVALCLRTGLVRPDDL